MFRHLARKNAMSGHSPQNGACFEVSQINLQNLRSLAGISRLLLCFRIGFLKSDAQPHGTLVAMPARSGRHLYLQLGNRRSFDTAHETSHNTRSIPRVSDLIGAAFLRLPISQAFGQFELDQAAAPSASVGVMKLMTGNRATCTAWSGSRRWRTRPKTFLGSRRSPSISNTMLTRKISSSSKSTSSSTATLTIRAGDNSVSTTPRIVDMTALSIILLCIHQEVLGYTK